MALSDRLRSAAGRAAVRALEVAARLQQFSASSSSAPPLSGIGVPSAGAYPMINTKTEERLAQPDVLDSRIAVRAGPLPTRISTYTASNLDPVRIDRVFRQADLGIAIYQYADLCKHMRERDAHLMGIDRQRRQGVANKPFLIWPTFDTDKLAVGMANAMRAIVDGIDGLPSAFYAGLSKNCDGWSLNELLWLPGKIRFQVPDGFGGGQMVTMRGIWPRSMEWVHSKHTEFVQDSDEPLLNLGSDGSVRLPRHKFMYTRAPGEGIASARGYSRAVVWMHFFKHASMRDWNVFLHLYGIPFLQGKMDRGMFKDANLKAVLELALKAYGSGEEAPILPDGLSIDVKDPVSMSGAGEAHKSMFGVCNAEESKAVLGEMLTIEPGESGSFKLGAVHQDSAHEVVVGDALTTACDVRTDIFLSAIELNADEFAKVFNVPPEDLALANPLCGFRTDREWSPRDRLAIFKEAAAIGVHGSKSQVRRELQIDKPASPDDEIKGEAVVLPDGAKAAGAADAAAGVNNPKDPPPGGAPNQKPDEKRPAEAGA